MPIRDELAFWGITVPEGFSLDDWVQHLKDRPCQNALVLVGLSTVAFYAAERDHNVKVNDIWDALEYCSTCISVGYADIFPRTPVGKIIGSLLMTIGPALASKTLDGRLLARQEDRQTEVVQLLRKIAESLAIQQPEVTDTPQGT